jgi:hypothetical protein
MKEISYGGIKLASDGRWFHEGVEITHERTIELFNRSIRREGDKYVLRVGNEVCEIEVEDAPFFVKQVNREENKLLLVISNGMLEELDPSSLEIGDNNILYAKVGTNKDRAKFTRPAYYQLMEYLCEDEGKGYFLKVGEKRYPLTL